MDKPVFKKPTPAGRKRDQEFRIACLTTSQSLDKPSRLRRLLLTRTLDDLVLHLSTPNKRPLSEAFIEATAWKPCPATPSKTSELSSSSVTEAGSQATKSLPASPKRQREPSPRTVFDMFRKLRDGELLPRKTMREAVIDTFSLVQSKSAKRKREEAVNLDDSPADERPQKQSKSYSSCDDDTVLSSSPTLPDDDGNCKSKLMDLPYEIHKNIIDELDLLSIIHLGLTSRYFLRLLAEHLKSMTATTLGQWAGECLICIGDMTSDSDFPPAVYKDPQLQRIFAPELNKLVDTEHPTLFEFARDVKLVLPPSIPTFVDCGFLLSKGFNDEFYNLPTTLRREMIDLLCPAMSDFYPDDVEWVLRNLTTKEYVLVEAASVGGKYSHGSQGAYFGFGDVILIRATWSTKAPTGIQIDKRMPIHRGVWAGHRFEVIPMEEHRREMIADSKNNRSQRQIGGPVKKVWKNVTNRVRNEVSRMWSRECGSNWKGVMMRRSPS
ncbi:hypothetical protein FQN49_001525 [Arthroderma sp. PD_2]|nr:hypothetical protein FQN49_001525 [Arthroderma sp. PD_2]